MSKKYTFLDTATNKRSFADVTNRASTLTVMAQTATAGKGTDVQPILRANVSLNKLRLLVSQGCPEDSCKKVEVTNKTSIAISGAYADQAELKAHLDEAVRVTLMAWTGYGLKDGFLPPINADFFVA